MTRREEFFDTLTRRCNKKPPVLYEPQKATHHTPMSAAIQIPLERVPLSREQEEWISRAWSQIDEGRLAQLDLRMATIPSPTGREKELAQFLASYLADIGLKSFYQPIDSEQGNAVGRLDGTGDGPELLLYAPIDTAFTGREEEDCPGVGLELSREMKGPARIEADRVIGPGAENPKGYATCIIAAAEAVRRANIPLKGSVIVGLGAGGMPTNKPPSLSRSNAGQGTGCAFMLEQGVRGDFAVIAKPGYSVAWEEVGLCWFKVQVKGALGYTGVRHVIDYRNSIIDAAEVVLALERWFPEYTRRNRSGLVAPQGAVNAIEAGWSYKLAFTPAVCTLYVDLRISPRTDPMDAKHQFAEALAQIQKDHPGLTLEWEMILSIPGGRTDPRNWIVQSCMRAWEHVEGRSHVPRTGTSGATDANVLRQWGVPTARLGMPRPRDAGAGGRAAFSMDVCPIAGMKQLTKCLVYSIIDTCTRDRAEVRLARETKSQS